MYFVALECSLAIHWFMHITKPHQLTCPALLVKAIGAEKAAEASHPELGHAELLSTPHYNPIKKQHH